MFEITSSIVFALLILAIISPLFFDGLNNFWRYFKENTFLLGINYCLIRFLS